MDFENETFVASIKSVQDTGSYEVINTVSGAAGQTASVTTTINDDDVAPTISINNVTVNEDAGTMTFTVSLSNATTANVNFNYATSNGAVNGATAGVDYVASAVGANGTIAAGLTSTTITVAINDDFLREGNETLNVTLSGLSANVATVGNTLVGLGTITDAGSTLTPPDVPEVIGAPDTVYAHISS